MTRTITDDDARAIARALVEELRRERAERAKPPARRRGDIREQTRRKIARIRRDG